MAMKQSDQGYQLIRSHICGLLNNISEPKVVSSELDVVNHIDNPFIAHLDNNSSIQEVALVCLICPISAVMRDFVISCLISKTRDRQLSTLLRFIVDSLCLGLPGIYCMTMFSDSQHDLVTLLLSIISILLLYSLNTDNQPHTSHIMESPSLMEMKMTQRRVFISYFRAYVNFSASVAILAVDFPSAFPVRFGKRQTYGTGLMDVGVGGYVMSYGIVSHEARTKLPNIRTTRDKLRHMGRVIKSTTPMWLLGVSRTLFIIVTGFHAHETEYGVHWNFFLTLAVVRVSSAAVLCICPAKYSWMVSVVMMVTYQCAVQIYDFSFNILYGPTDDIGSREGIMNANREGLVSNIGYLAIYLAAVSIGWYLARIRNNYRDWLHVLVVLVLLDVLLYNVLIHIINVPIWIEPISRRMANLPFVLWMIAHQLLLLCAFFVVDLLYNALVYANILYRSQSSEFCLMEAVNRNGLLYFVLANILVGVVNLSVDTKNASSNVAYCILFFYMLTLACTCGVLHVKNITLKWW